MDNNQDKLKRDILSRHIVMISLGGTISASFFLGIGSILNTVGAFGTVIGFFYWWHNNDVSNDQLD